MNIEFRRLTIDDIACMRKYFDACVFHISDYSAAFKAMWQEYFTEYFAYVEGCLVFKEYFQGRTYFHYPLSLNDEAAEDRAIDALETFCRDNNVRLHFTSVPREKICRLITRYGSELRITNKRRWRDYLYNAQDFVSYAGKKFSGQRNHVNKFKKNYPEWEYCSLSSADGDEIRSFLKEYEARQLSKGSVIAREELRSVYKLTDVLDLLGLIAGGIRAGEKLVAYSVGEVCGDKLIIHVEKALTQYEGAYTIMAQEFARHNVRDGIRFINREDDAGDRGLRKSKLQYNPVELVDKFNVLPHRAIDLLSHLPCIPGEGFELREIDDMAAKDFFKLESDRARNKYWGYDWREHFSGEPTPEYFLRGIREDFRNKDELPLGIYAEGYFAGEVVLHKFGYRGDCEIGVRLLPEYEGRGLARNALFTLMEYAFFELDIETVFAKCFKANERSRKALLAAGMRADGEDEVFYYFKKTAAM